MQSVCDFCEHAFRIAGLNYLDFVEVNDYFFRPSVVVSLCGDASKAERVLQWKPRTNFKQLVEIMVEEDMKLAAEEKKLGHFIPFF
jgi:GDPmannose 4,6-dehydratase